MVIVDVVTGHGPHLWFCSYLFDYWGNYYLDFLRLERAHVKRHRNDYCFDDRIDAASFPNLLLEDPSLDLCRGM